MQIPIQRFLLFLLLYSVGSFVGRGSLDIGESTAVACQDEVSSSAESSIESNATTSLARSRLDPWTIRVIEAIDGPIAARAAEAGASLTGAASDAEFLRRAYLDLTGCQPAPSLVVSYLASSQPDKRWQLLTDIGKSNAMSSRMADYWSEILLPENSEAFVEPQRLAMRRWLMRKFSEGMRYDRLVAELLIATGDSSEQPTAFFSLLEAKPEKLAEKTARVFLGVSLDCAQCHDHPFEAWKQKDFWGLAAYFAQVKSDPSMNMQRVSIHDSSQGEVTLPNTEQIIPPKPLLPGVESALGIGSRRQQLAIWVTSRQNEWFSRAAVNRVWAMLMGRGLVEPIDDMGPNSQGSYPEILQSLTQLFKEGGYDLKRLILAIVSSDTYARSSRNWNHTNADHLILGMHSKPLTSSQIAACLRFVARKSLPVENQDEWNQFAIAMGKTRGENADFVGGILQSLQMQNSAAMEQVWNERVSTLLQALDAPFLDRKSKLEWQFLATLGRPFHQQEEVAIDKWLQTQPDEEAFRAFRSDLLWAIVNSTEFAMTP